MARAAKNTGTVQPTPQATKAIGKASPQQAKATGQTPADWTFPKPAASTSALTPEQRAALQATPAAKAQAKTPAPKTPPAKAKPPKAPATPTGPQPGETYIIGPLDGDDLWEFAPVNAKPGAAVIVRCYQGYALLREHRRSAAYAAKLSHELRDRGYVWIDGVHYKLVDED